MNTQNCIIIGREAAPNLLEGNNCILIGDNVAKDITKADYLFALRIDGKDYFTDISEKEFKILREVIHRALGISKPIIIGANAGDSKNITKELID